MTTSLLRAPRPIPHYVADQVADAAKAALLEELETWPKPGLVSHVDSGSHTDMDASTLRASATAITPFYYQLTVAGAAESGMNRLREIGLEARKPGGCWISASSQSSRPNWARKSASAKAA